MIAYSTHGFETILNPRSQCPYTGKESVTVVSENVKLFVDDHGSYRFVMYIKGRSVSALQIVKGKSYAQVANVITVEKHRRKGYAKTLFNHAKELFGTILHSSHLSPLGLIFAQKVN